MRYSLFFTFLLFCAFCKAQPTLTAPNTNIASTDAINDYSFYNYESPGPSGANVTWDFTGAIWNGNSPPLTFTTVASSPYASQFPNANVCEMTGFTAVYSYYDASATALTYYGDGGPGFTRLTEPQDQMRYPFTYGSSFSDTWAGKYLNSNNDSTIQKGTITVNADGYGTVFLLHGYAIRDTFTNVLRTHTIVSYKDSTMTSPPSISYGSYSYYSWYAPCIHLPVVTEVIPNGYLQTLAMPVSSCSDAVQEFGSEESLITYPNPCDRSLTVSFLKTSTRTKVVIVDLLGRVWFESLDNQAMLLRINTAEIPTGVYLLKTEGDQKTISTKIFISH